MSRFDREVLDACRAVDHEFGEPIVYLPRAESEDKSAPDGADASRPTLRLVAVFVEKPAEPNEPNSYDVRQARRPGLAAVNVWVEIAPGQIEEALAAVGLTPPFPAKAGDQIQRVDGGQVYKFAAAPMVSVNGVLKARLNRIA